MKKKNVTWYLLYARQFFLSFTKLDEAWIRNFTEIEEVFIYIFFIKMKLMKFQNSKCKFFLFIILFFRSVNI